MNRSATSETVAVPQAGAIFLVAFNMDDLGVPSPRYRDRLDAAVELGRQTNLPIFCLGGLLAGRRYTNAFCSLKYLQNRGVLERAICILDRFPFLDESVETIQEAEAAAALARHLKVARLIVITDFLQFVQVRLVLRRLGIDAVPATTPTRAGGFIHTAWYVAIRVCVLLITTVDRRGRALGWLRASRRGGRAAVLASFLKQ